jgi:hypothetical protein
VGKAGSARVLHQPAEPIEAKLALGVLTQGRRPPAGTSPRRSEAAVSFRAQRFLAKAADCNGIKILHKYAYLLYQLAGLWPIEASIRRKSQANDKNKAAPRSAILEITNA